MIIDPNLQQAFGYLLPTLGVMKNLHGFLPKNILDIGSAHGHFTRLMKVVWPDAGRYCVEANMACEAFYGDLDAISSWCGLGDRDGTLTFYKDGQDPVSHGNGFFLEDTPAFAEGRVISEQVAVRKLDTLWTGVQFDFIKIDTQGSEYDIIMGGKNTISRAKAVLVECSFLKYNKGAPLIDDVIRVMQHLGFMIYDIVGPWNGGFGYQGRKTQADVMFIRRDLESWLSL